MIWKKQPVGSKLEALNAKIPTGNVFDEILIPEGSDINNYRTAGTFIVQNDSTAAQISNMPRSASGRLIVMNRTTSSYIVQEYYPTTVDPIKYVRNYNNGTWTNWEQIALNSKIENTGKYVNGGLTALKSWVTIDSAYKVKIGNIVCYNVVFMANQNISNGDNLIGGFEIHKGGYNGVPTIPSTNNTATVGFFGLDDSGNIYSIDSKVAGRWRMSVCYVCD